MDLYQLKEAGQAPKWLTPEGYQTLQGGYLLEGETPLDLYRRVASAAASYYQGGLYKGKDIKEELFNILWEGYIGLATPVAANLGTTRGLPISCYSTAMPDSIDGIFRTVHEVAVLTSKGGGVAVHLNNVRSSGTPISSGGSSDGVVPWCKVIDSTTIAVNQGGGLRRGATAVYLPIEHGDFHDFLRIRRPTGDVNRQCLNIHNAITIPDSFMKRLMEGDPEARSKWLEILSTRVETGEPYIFFEDTVNEVNPPMYKDRGFKVLGSNLCCLTGDTLVQTTGGAIPIANLVGRTVTIWDGEEWVENSNFELKGRGKVLEITLSNRTTILCTDNHRWFVASSVKQAREGKWTETYASDLCIGDYVEPFDLPEGGRLPRITGISRPSSEYKVYCTTVPTTGKFALANGVMTGNSEITLMTDERHSFVCCLSSINLARTPMDKLYEVAQYGIILLDAVITEFIAKATATGQDIMENTIRFAKKSRALGLGVLGYHTLLQSKGIVFESEEARALNTQVFKTINDASYAVSKEMATELGEPEWCLGYGLRHTHRLSVAPTVSNSIICGNVSQGIEPITANSYVKNTAKGIFFFQNPILKQILAARGYDSSDVWNSITHNNGSVAHLSFLSDHEKEVFKTAREIDQLEIIQQAADRQDYIDQSQSVNLFFKADTNPNYINKVHLNAWSKGLKTLYYCRSEAIQSGNTNVSTSATKDTPPPFPVIDKAETPDPTSGFCASEPGCSSCEG